MRDVFIDPKKNADEFKLNYDEVLKLLRPLYGLADAGDYWNATMSRHMRDDLGMNPTTGDISLFTKHVGSELCGIAGTYVDDSLLSGNADFLKLSDMSQQKFNSRERQFDHFTFAGVDISTEDDGQFALSQTVYIRKLVVLPEEAIFPEFRSMRAKLSWLTHTRPEIAHFVNSAAQVTEETFDLSHVKLMNSTIKALKKTAERKLLYQNLELKSLRIVSYADASFANNEDLMSQLGFITFLTDKTGRCNLVHASSHKCRRVTRSILGGGSFSVR
jgi:Reverse transcriptase (RNA-dependent DNA polymerase)